MGGLPAAALSESHRTRKLHLQSIVMQTFLAPKGLRQTTCLHKPVGSVKSLKLLCKPQLIMGKHLTYILLACFKSSITLYSNINIRTESAKRYYEI